MEAIKQAYNQSEPSNDTVLSDTYRVILDSVCFVITKEINGGTTFIKL